MPGNVKKAPKKFQHVMKKEQQQPFSCTPITYGAKKYYATQESTSPPLDKIGKKFIQQVCGKNLLLGLAVAITLLCTISAIASQSAKPTEDTMKQTCSFSTI